MLTTAEIIKKRLKEANIRYHCNDNISEFIEEGELEILQLEVEDAFSNVLNSLVIDTNNDHNTKETAKRVAKMFIKEWLRSPSPIENGGTMGDFIQDNGYILSLNLY